jgi:membrane associated rhomboid family serine protease
MWVVYWAEVRFNINLNFLGIYPKKFEGLRGILFSPFIHSGLKHLFNNSVPLLVLTTALFYFYNNIKWRVLLIGTLLTGIVTWVIGRPALHIGASGIVYMLTSFLLFKGIVSKQYQLTALSFAVIFLYGSFIWYVFPIDPQISWEGHLSGFVVGFVFALLFKGDLKENRKFDWEREDYSEENDPFMKHFDSDGNFIETLPEAEDATVEKDSEISTETKKPRILIRYSIKRKGDDSLN